MPHKQPLAPWPCRSSRRLGWALLVPSIIPPTSRYIYLESDVYWACKVLSMHVELATLQLAYMFPTEPASCCLCAQSALQRSMNMVLLLGHIMQYSSCTCRGKLRCSIWHSTSAQGWAPGPGAMCAPQAALALPLKSQVALGPCSPQHYTSYKQIHIPRI